MTRWIPLSTGLVCGALAATLLTTAQARTALAPEPALRLEASAPATDSATGEVDCVVLRPPTEASLEAWFSHQLAADRDHFVTGDGAIYQAQGVSMSPSEWICALRVSDSRSTRARSRGRSTRSR